MTTISGTPRPAYVYDEVNDMWVPIAAIGVEQPAIDQPYFLIGG